MERGSIRLELTATLLAVTCGGIGAAITAVTVGYAVAAFIFSAVAVVAAALGVRVARGPRRGQPEKPTSSSNG